jgi:tetratricopeptide (TPR) repeat protein
LSLSRQSGNTWAIAASLNALGPVALALEAYEEAQRCLNEGLALSRSLEDRYNIAVSLSGLGRLHQTLAQYDEAQRYFQDSITLWREIGTQAELAGTLNSLGETFRQIGDHATARRCFHEALALAVEIQVMPVALEAVLGFAALQLEAQTPKEALVLVRAVLQNPSPTYQTKERANNLLTKIEADPPSAQLPSPTSSTTSFETLVAELLYAPPSGSLPSSSR